MQCKKTKTHNGTSQKTVIMQAKAGNQEEKESQEQKEEEKEAMATCKQS